MVRLLKIKRRNKHQESIDRPEAVTGNFELHFEEVVKRNRLVIISFVSTGLIAIAAFIPAAVYQSTAENGRVNLEVEKGIITNPALVTQVKGDTSAGDGGYVEFGPPYCLSGQSPVQNSCIIKP